MNEQNVLMGWGGLAGVAALLQVKYLKITGATIRGNLLLLPKRKESRPY